MDSPLSTIGKPAILLVLAISLTAMLLASGCGDETADNSDTASTTSGNEHVTLQEKDPVTEEAVTKMVTRKVGSTDYAGEPIIHYISITPEGQGMFVDIGVGRPPSCHPGQVVGYITEMSQGFMSSLFLYPDVEKVKVTLFGTTDAREDRDIMAAYTVMTKADAQAIDDWFAYTETTASQMSTEFWVEPTIYANWQKYGSSAITDPALLEQANQ